MEEGYMTGMRTGLTGISMAVKASRLLSWMAVIAVVFLMLQPVELGFSHADVLLPTVAVSMAIVAWTVMMVRRVSFQWNIIDALLLTWFMYVLLRAWCTPEVPCCLSVSRALSLMMLYTGLRMLFTSVRVSVLTIERSLMLFALTEGLFCFYQLFTDSSRHANYPFTGSFLNPAPCSAVLFIGVLLGLYSLYDFISSRKRISFSVSLALPVSTLLVCSLLLPLGWSRAALVAACCVLAIKIWGRMTVRHRLLMLLGLSVIVLLLYFLKRGSADGRVLFYLISSSAAAQHPVFGSGIGSFALSYARETALLHSQLPWTLVRHADGVEYALSDGMLVAVEQGLLGLVLALSLICILLCRLRRISIPLMLMLVGLLIFSLFSYPFQLLPFQLLTVLLASLAASTATDDDKQEPVAFPVRTCLVGIALCGMMAGIAFPFTSYLNKHVQAARESRLIVGRVHPRLITEYRRLMPWMRHDASFMFRYGQILASYGRYNESNQVLWQGTLVSGDPMFHVIRGHNYQQMHACPQACHAYQQAHAQSPSRQYPLLCLMRMYRDMGCRSEAVRTARILLRMPPQHSPLAKQIREEAQKCINEQ